MRVTATNFFVLMLLCSCGSTGNQANSKTNEADTREKLESACEDKMLGGSGSHLEERQFNTVVNEQDKTFSLSGKAGLAIGDGRLESVNVRCAGNYTLDKDGWVKIDATASYN